MDNNFIPSGGDQSSVTMPGTSKPPPAAALNQGNNFSPLSGAQTGGTLAQHAATQTPVNQDDSQVTPQEQKLYDDFVTRGLLFINDPRVPLNKNGSPQPGGKAPRDTIIQHMNAVGNQAVEVAVGRTAAQVVAMITDNATHQGFPYPPDVVFHGSDEIIQALYKIGVAAGVLKGVPPVGSPGEAQILGVAKIYGAQFYGQHVISTGQDTPGLQSQNQQYMLAQIHREGASGGLDNWSPAHVTTPQKLTTFIHKAATGTAQVKPGGPPRIADFAARGHPRLVPGGPGDTSPPPQPSAPPGPTGAAPAPDASQPPPAGGQ